MSDYSTQVSTEFHGATTDPAEVSLTLEQRPFPQDSGSIKTMQEIAEENGLSFIMAVGDLVISSDIEEIYNLYYAQCGANADGSITATIYVFKHPNTLSYNLVASYGELDSSNVITASVEKEESVNFNMNIAVDLGYVVENIVSIEWEGNVYNSSGGILNIGTPQLSGTSLVASEPVLGTARVKFKVFADTWELNIPKREDSDDYSSTVHAFYGDSKVETLQISSPNLTGGCEQSVQVCINNDCEQPADGEGEGEDEEGDGTSVALQLSAYDYCSGSAISGATFWIEGKQVPATGHTVKRGVSYSIIVKASGYKDSDTDDLTDNDGFTI